MGVDEPKGVCMALTLFRSCEISEYGCFWRDGGGRGRNMVILKLLVPNAQ